MPTAVRPIELHRMEVRFLRALGEPCGVVVFDAESGEAAFRFRRDWHLFAGDEAPTLEALAADFEVKFREMGAQSFFSWIDSSLSGSFSVDDKTERVGRNAETTAQALYRRDVPTKPLEGSCLPLYSIRAAAGGFGPDSESEKAIEVEIPGQRTAREDEFVLRITGRSMEPDIPDGSLCIFRKYSAGTRAGKIVLVQRVSESDSGGEVTIKRYSSEKKPSASGWEHIQIGMHPKNPEFADWELDETERNRTIAIFVRVLEEPLD